MATDKKKVVADVTLMCGGRKCCPKTKVYEDGSVEIVDTDDGKNERIVLDDQQARLLRDTLNERLP
jgi:hypothetical protein